MFLMDDLASNDPCVPIDIDSLEDFIEEYIDLNLLPNEQAPDPSTYSYSPFPMLPYLTMSTSGGIDVDFGTYAPCSKRYQRTITEYFEQIAAQQSDEQPNNASEEDSKSVLSMAGLIFVDSFKMILRSVVGAAIDEMKEFEIQAAGSESLQDIATRVGLDGSDAVMRIAQANIDSDKLLLAGTPISLIAAAQLVDTECSTLSQVAERLHLPIQQVARALRQQQGILSDTAGVKITVPNGRYLSDGVSK